jgi:hypothetical protein
MSQPLTGQIRPIQRHLSNPEGRLLYLLADMVDHHTGSTPRTCWAAIGQHFGWARVWTKEVGRSLRRRGLISTSDSDGRGFRISVVPGGVVHNHPQRVVPDNPQRVVANPRLDTPPITPSGPKTARDRQKGGTRKEDRGKQEKASGPPTPVRCAGRKD